MKTIKRAALSAALAMLGVASLVAEQRQTPAEVLASARLLGSGERFSLTLSMRIEENGDSKTRTIAVSIDQAGGDSLLFAGITEPAFLSSMKYLRVQRKGSPLQQWIKTSRGVSRIAGNGSGERVFGSHFTAEDFGQVGVEGFTLSWLEGDGAKPGTLCVVGLPVGAGSSYARKVFTIDEASRLLVAIDSYGADGAKLRSYRLEETCVIDGAAFPKRAVMEDLRTGGRTIVQIADVRKVASFPSRTFNSASL
jgi:hypothetical protein